MSQANLNNEGQPIKVLWMGDLVNPTGFGRIGNEITIRLAQRGWQMCGVSIPWDGWPPSPLPYYVRPTGGQDIWNRLVHTASWYQPDVVVVCQDLPYAQTAFYGCKIDWSKTKFVIVTPIDGTPIHRDWLKTVDMADATFIISQFGVEMMRKSGQAAHLLHPGVNTNEFYPAESPDEVTALRQMADIDPEAFVIGSFMMNQGRKAVTATLDAFKEFALDKPDAILYLDMERRSPAGWDLPAVIEQVDPAGAVLRIDDTVRFRDKIQEAGVAGLRERFLLCDLTSQVSHREGFGLPNMEGQACKVPPTVLDWCSGPEIAGGERGVLVRRIDYMEMGTWGGARDAFPDMKNWIGQWCNLYKNRDRLARLATAGYEWAIQNTWDKAADQLETVLKRITADLRIKERTHEPTEPDAVVIPAPGHSDTYGPGHGQPDRPGIQQPPGGVSMPGGAGVDGGPEPDGDTGAGRRIAGVQPDDAAPAAGDQAAAERAQPGVRGERQRRSHEGERGVPASRQSGHAGPTV